jgi:hypothetical protein
MSGSGFDVLELGDPIEVWKAVEGDERELIALLRSNEPLTRRMRDALADWREGKLQPVKVPPGPPGLSLGAQLHRRIGRYFHHGYDIDTPVGWACYRYRKLRDLIRRTGRHKIGAGPRYWSTERTLEFIARRYSIDPVILGEHVKRGRQRVARVDVEQETRLEIARKIRAPN